MIKLSTAIYILLALCPMSALFPLEDDLKTPLVILSALFLIVLTYIKLQQDIRVITENRRKYKDSRYFYKEVYDDSLN